MYDEILFFALISTLIFFKNSDLNMTKILEIYIIIDYVENILFRAFDDITGNIVD